MGWLKRNFLFAIGIAVAVALLGAAAFYVYKSMQRNDAAYQHLTEIYNTLKSVNNMHPSPGDEKVDNIKTARTQADELHQWIQQSKQYFQPIDPIPAKGPVSNETFGSALHRTVDELRREADAANVVLPPQYNFSFETLMPRTIFAPGSLGSLSTQLGEVKAISEILYSARVNALDSIQRVAVSDDDTAGPPTDYTAFQPMTNDLAVLTPYQVTFRGFSPEISKALSAFATSSHGFLIKSISVQPANIVSQGMDNGGQLPAMPVRGGLPTVLDEQMLRVTLTIEVIKLSPRIS